MTLRDLPQHHKWKSFQKTYGSRYAECERCGLAKDMRFDRNHHWIEYRRPAGEWFSADKVPPCDPDILILTKP